jgi:hypothetical protein
MYQLIYTSEASVAFSAEDLRKLLAAARAKNKINLITGMLVFCDNQFLQVLEGDAAAVVRAFNTIEKDTRHESLIVLHRGYSHVGRTFSASAMGFHSLALHQDLPKGFTRENGRVNFLHFDGLMALNFLTACCEQPALN